MLTFNVLGLRGYSANGDRPFFFDEPSRDLTRHLAGRIAQWRADIVVLQEAPPREIIDELAGLTGMNRIFLPAQSIPGPDWPFGFPGAILSRFPIVEHNAWLGRGRDVPDGVFQRHWGEATVAVRGESLRIVGLHLCSDWGGVRRESTRLEEIRLALENRHADILAGDFNFVPGSAPWKEMASRGWRDAWMEAGHGEGPTSNPRKLWGRIDYIWMSPESRWKVLSARVPDDIQVEAAGKTLFLSDHFPVLIELAVPDISD